MTQGFVFLTSAPDNTDIDRGQGVLSVKECSHGLLSSEVVSVFIRHFNFSEVVVSSKHPKKLWIQEKHHGKLGRALNQVTRSEFNLQPFAMGP